MDQVLLVAIILLIMVLIYHFVQTNYINQELSMLKETQRLNDLEDSEREKELNDLKYQQDKYDRWRYWADNWNRPWRYSGVRYGGHGGHGGHRVYRRHGGHH